MARFFKTCGSDIQQGVIWPAQSTMQWKCYSLWFETICSHSYTARVRILQMVCIYQQNEWIRPAGGYPGGTQIWVGQGCAARASKPIPIFKGDFGQKGYPCLRIFLQKWAYFSKILRFSGFSHGENPENHVIWGSVRKVDPCLRIFWVKNGTHVEGFLVKKRPIRAAHPRLAIYVSTPRGDINCELQNV